METPPRAWRRSHRQNCRFVKVRNTSTCVEKIVTGRFSLSVFQKHLHVRGEDSEKIQRPALIKETPPRAWRRFKISEIFRNHVRNTSTCVEKILFCIRPINHLEKHLHVRGEDLNEADWDASEEETPPRAWRRY